MITRQRWNQWLTDQRGEEYVQITGSLGSKDSINRCALGVLQPIETTEEAGWNAVYDLLPGTFKGIYYGEPADIPYVVYKWNDRDHLSFSEIADKLEQEVAPLLFGDQA